MSGMICSGSNGVCTPGCGLSPRNDCPTGLMCTNVANGAGQCTSPTGCAGDADCANPLPRCATAAGAGRCVECLADGDCPAPLVCNPAGERVRRV